MYLVRVAILLFYLIIAVWFAIPGYRLIVVACSLMMVVLFDVWMANSLFQMRDFILFGVSAFLMVASIWMQSVKIGPRFLSREAAFYCLLFLGLLVLSFGAIR